MTKKSPPKKISDKEKARRKAASVQALDESHTAPKKLQGKDMHYGVTAPRLMRHQGR
jgi:hypothetical protein